MGHSDLGSSCCVLNFARPATRILQSAATCLSFANAVGSFRFESCSFKRNFRPFLCSQNRSKTSVKPQCNIKSHNLIKSTWIKESTFFIEFRTCGGSLASLIRRSISWMDSVLAILRMGENWNHHWGAFFSMWAEYRKCLSAKTIIVSPAPLNMAI